MQILFRKSFDQEEFETAKEYFNVVEHRTSCIPGETIVGRYSVLPYYQELEVDLTNIGCKLINSFSQHNWIANFDYYEELKDYTFQSWNDYNFWECKHSGPFVVKGRTNSRKSQWNKLMFAENMTKALEIASDLMQDGLIGPQGVIYRKFEKLKSTGVGINGIPYSNEWRFFFLGDKMLSYGYYWADGQEYASIDTRAIELAKEIASIAKDFVNFFVLDLAELETGEWKLVEVNDGQMSGLSWNKASDLYGNLSSIS